MATEDVLLRGAFAMPVDVAAPVESDAGDLGEESLGESFEGVDVELPESIEEEVAPDLDMEPEEDVDSDVDFLPEDVVRARKLSDRIDYAWSVYGELERQQEMVEFEYGQIPNSEHIVGSTRSLDLSSRWESLQVQIREMLKEIDGLQEERRLGGEVVRQLTSGDPEAYGETAGVEGMDPQELVRREAEQWRLFEEVGSTLSDPLMEVIEAFPERAQKLILGPKPTEKQVARLEEQRRVFVDVPLDFWSRFFTGEGTGARQAREWSRQVGLGEATARRYTDLGDIYDDIEASLALKPDETFEGTNGPLLPAIFMSRRAHVPLWNTRVSPHLRPEITDPMFRRAPERFHQYTDMSSGERKIFYPQSVYEASLRTSAERPVAEAERALAMKEKRPPWNVGAPGVEVYLDKVNPRALENYKKTGKGNPWYGGRVVVSTSGLPPSLQGKGLGKEAYLRVLEFAKLNNNTLVSSGPRSSFSEGIYRWMQSEGIPWKAYDARQFERWGAKEPVNVPSVVRPEPWMSEAYHTVDMDEMERQLRERNPRMSNAELRSRVVEAHRKHYLEPTIERGVGTKPGQLAYIQSTDKFRSVAESFYGRYQRKANAAKANEFWEYMRNRSAAGFSQGRPHNIPDAGHPYKHVWVLEPADLQKVDLRPLRARASMSSRSKLGKSDYQFARGVRYAQSPEGQRIARQAGVQKGRRLGLVKRPVETKPGVVSWFLAPIIATGGVVAAGAKQDVVERYYSGRSLSLGRPLTTDDMTDAMKREMRAKPDIVEKLKAGGFISYALYRDLGGKE